MIRRALFLVVVLLALASSAFCQGARYDNTATVNVFGVQHVVANATIRVCSAGSTGSPCSPLASIYSNIALNVPLANPFNADANGNYYFFASPTVAYDIQISGTGIATITQTNVTMACATGCPGLSTNNAFTGNNTHSGIETFNTNAIVANAGITSAGPNTLSGGGSTTGAWTDAGLHTFNAGLSSVGPNTLNGGGALAGAFSHSGSETFASLNSILYVGIAVGQYASLQAAHDILPSTGGTVFVTATALPFGVGNAPLAITKPIHIIFDCGNFTYSGSAAQTISNTSRGVIVEGCGRRGDDVGTAGTTITVTNTATNGISNSGGGATFRDFNLIGPGSGTGKGVINTAGRVTYSNLNISSFGSDGWTNDGSATNANSVLVSKVRSSANGGNGFVTKGSNGQLVGFSEADGSLNTGDGFNIANQLNVFFATNADGNTGYDYHFLSGGTGNKGDIFSNNAGAGPPGGIQFDAGANSNNFTQLGSGGTLLVTSGLGTNNSVWSQAQTTYTSGDNNMTLGLSSGVGAGIRGSSINFQDNNTNKWTVQKTSTNTFAVVNPGIMNRIELVTGAQSDLNAEGTTAVRFNSKNLAATSTGGVEGWSGGASSAKMWQGTAGGLLVDVNAVTPCTNGELALSAGWQSTGAATVTAVQGTGQTCSWTITTGTTTAANPTITDTLTNALPTATTVCWMNIYGGTHTAVAGESLRQTTLSATAPVFTANFTPTNTGATYFVTRGCGP